jgi:filamentous hemagglutinin
MAFPVSPTNGQITEINGINYQFVSADSAWVRIPASANIVLGNITANNITANANVTAGRVYTTNGLFWAGNGVAFSSGTGITVTVDSIPPTTGNIKGDRWYDITNDTLFEYIDDGTSSYWVDVQSPITYSSLPTTLPGNLTVAGNLSTSGNMSVTGNITGANVITGVITATGTITTTSNLSSANIQTGNITSTGTITTTGNLSSANVQTGNITATGTIITTSNLASANIQTGNISATGDITTTGSFAAIGNITSANIVTGNITASFTTTTANLVTTNGVFWANGVSAVGPIYGNTQVAQYLPTFTGTLTPSLITNSGNLTVAGNVFQQQAYYETFGNLTNVGGNLTCNFNNGTVFNVTSITANVTANFTNVNAISNGATGAVVILTQGATAYRIANVQVNGVNTYVRWVNGNGSGTAPMGIASNTDIVSFSIMHLGSGTYTVFGQLSTFA